MYTDEERNTSLKPVFFKILLVVLILFALMLLFPTKGFITNYFDKKNENTTSGDSNFNSNIIAMATAGSGYYNESRLPKETGEESKMTLKEMYDQKIIVKFTDSNGISCSTKKSYVLVTRGESEYTMKVNLSCADKNDYIMLHMGLNETQFPSTSTARCTFVKNLDEVWTYGQWSDWGTEKIVENGTNQVETYTKTINAGNKIVTRQEIETAPANKFTYNNTRTYYECSKKYDNAGTYSAPTTCKRTITVYSTQPAYKTVTYYRSRTKILEKSGSTDKKEADCNDTNLLDEGYTLEK